VTKMSRERDRGLSREGSGYGSTGTIWSEDRLSSREVERVRKWVNEREREGRKENVVIRGVEMPEEVTSEKKRRIEWVKGLIRNKIGVECEISDVKKSGPVIVVRIVGEEGKKKVMSNKYKLKGGNMFIENDLSYEERKVQEKMNRWAKEKRAEGVEVKVGRGRLRLRGKWIGWEEIEREEREKRKEELVRRGEERERKEGREEDHGRLGEEERNFG